VRVLVADDSKAMRMIVIRTLRQSGVHIDEIHEAADGAFFLLSKPFDGEHFAEVIGQLVP